MQDNLKTKLFLFKIILLGEKCVDLIYLFIYVFNYLLL